MKKMIVLLCGILLMTGCTAGNQISIPSDSSEYTLDHGINEYVSSSGIFYTVYDSIVIQTNLSHPYRMDDPQYLTVEGAADYTDCITMTAYYYPDGCSNQEGSCEIPVREYYIYRTDAVPSENIASMVKVGSFGRYTVSYTRDNDTKEQSLLRESEYDQIEKNINEMVQFGSSK